MEFRKNNWEDLKEKHRDKIWGIKEKDEIVLETIDIWVNDKREC